MANASLPRSGHAKQTDNDAAPTLVLASSSPWRRELLQRLGLNFDCASPNIDESSANGELLDKPGTHSNAVSQLTRSSGQQVYFYTSLYLLNSSTGASQQHCEPFNVQFRTLTLAEIEAYLRREQPLIALNRMLINWHCNPLLQNAR
ncbi:Maf family protein [Marinobacter gelidimuriae]|uniref:Maf family protein n=1 Tax=Marinobacter gelidimuriae TaxID=2739064 RepID=UPI00037FF474|nr:Maf family protein [Marinobacter gelidimuriae]